jgi:hypothetical protein
MVSSENWFGASPSFYNGATSTSMRFRRGVGSNTELNRDPSSAGNRKKHTLAFWVKRCKPSDGSQIVLCAFASSYSDFAYFRSDDKFEYTLGNAYSVATDMVFRDTSAWYHIVAHFDVANSTTTNRLRFWVNGVEQSKTVTYGSYPADQDYAFSNTVDQTVGGATHFSGYELDGYLCDLNFIDGSLVPYTSFGEFKNGIWVPIKIDTSAITYGTNGFRMLFNGTDTDGASTSGSVNANSVGASSVNSNHFHAYSTALANHSALPDSPENNFCTLNPLYMSAGTVSEGNLRYDNSAWNEVASTFAFSSGKWYFEVRFDDYDSSAQALGVGIREVGRQQIASGSWWHRNTWSNATNGYVYGVNVNGTTEYKITGGSETSIESSAPEITANVVVGIAIDLDSSTTSIKYNVDGGTFFTLFEDMEALTYHPAIDGYQAQATINFGQDSSFAGQETATSNADANGNGTFHSAVPSGYLSLCSANLPETTISPNADTQADDHFNTVLYTGNDSNGHGRTGVGFQPDWTWIKARTDFRTHVLYDSTRGAGKYLSSDSQNGQGTDTTSFASFDPDGFTVGTSENYINNSSHTYVAWNWKAGGATPSKTYKVKVVSDSTDYGHGTGSNKYQFFKSDGSTGFGTNGVDLDLQEGGTYTFDWSDSSAQSHPLRFSLTNDGTHSSGTSAGSEYTTGVVKDDSAYLTTITLPTTASGGVANLYYYCQNHSGMGAEVRTNALFGQTNFDAGSGSNISNGTANIATVQENQDAGFSIVTTTLTVRSTAVATIPHGLGSTPHFILAKQYDTANIWSIYHQDIPSNSLMLGGSYGDDAMNSNSNFSSVGSTTFGHQTNSISNNANENHIFYCFKEIAGYSRFGSYTGNGSDTDGTYVFTGFDVGFVVVKNKSTGSWTVYDNARNPFNNRSIRLAWNVTNDETDTSTQAVSFFSNGFKLMSNNSDQNATGAGYVYMAFSSSAPFKYANAI